MGLGLRTMEQRITAGGNFDATLPAGVVVRGSSIEAFPASSAGGRFDFELTEPVFVRTLELKLGGQASWTVHKLDKDGDELLVACGTNESDFITTDRDSFVLTARQSLLVRTVGASLAMMCRISIQSPV